MDPLLEIVQNFKQICEQHIKLDEESDWKSDERKKEIDDLEKRFVEERLKEKQGMDIMRDHLLAIVQVCGERKIKLDGEPDCVSAERKKELNDLKERFDEERAIEKQALENFKSELKKIEAITSKYEQSDSKLKPLAK